MVEMNRRQGRGGGRRHSRLRSTLSRSPTPLPPTPPLSPAATPITPPTTPPPSSSSPLPGQPVVTTLMEGKSGSLENRENPQSAQMANGPEIKGRLPDAVTKDQQLRNSISKASVADVTRSQPAPFTSSALPDDKANAIPSVTTPTTVSGSGPGPKTPLDKVQQLSRKRERTPSPTLSAGLPNSKRPAISSSQSTTSST